MSRSIRKIQTAFIAALYEAVDLQEALVINSERIWDM